jgi:hypothetical protein
MVSFNWIDRQMSFLSARLGVYRLDAGDRFFFDPTPGFYGFISQGTTACLNEAIQILASHIDSGTAPTIEEWKGSQNPLVASDYDWTRDKTPPGMIRYSGPHRSRIEINIVNKHSPYVLGAILAHELTHHFLGINGISRPEVQENERLTDLATAYIGLGKLTVNGYAPISWTRSGPQGMVTYKYQVGYLSMREMATVLHRVCRFRSLSLETAKRNLSPEALDLFNSLIAPADEYHLKKQLAGDRQCPHCEAISQFSFSGDDDGLRCSACGWEWSRSFSYAYKKRRSLLQRFMGRLKVFHR